MRKEVGTRKRGWLKNQMRKDGSDLHLGWTGAAPLTLADLFWVAWTHWRSRHILETYTQGLSKPGLTAFSNAAASRGLYQVIGWASNLEGNSFEGKGTERWSQRQCILPAPVIAPAMPSEEVTSWFRRRHICMGYWKETGRGKKGKKKERGRLHRLIVPGFFSLVSWETGP